MDGQEHGRLGLSGKLGKKLQQHHGIGAQHHVEPWKPAGSRSAHSNGTVHSLYYAPLTAAHPSAGSCRQRGQSRSYAGSVSSEASSNNKDNELRSSRIFKPTKQHGTKLLVDQALPSSRGRIRCSQGNAGDEARRILKPLNGVQFDTHLQSTVARPQVLSSGSYSTVVTSTFSVSDSMLIGHSRCNKASAVIDASISSTASPSGRMAGIGGSSSMHRSCSPSRGLHQQLLFGMQGGCAQQHTSPAALRYLFQEPSSNIGSSGSSSSSSKEICSSEQKINFQGILQDSGMLGQQQQQQRQRRLTAQGHGMLPFNAPEQLQEVSTLGKTPPDAVTYHHGPGSMVNFRQSCASEAARDDCSCVQEHPQGRFSQPQSIPPPQSKQPSSQQNSTRQWPSAQLRQADQHPTTSRHSSVSPIHAGCANHNSAASIVAQQMPTYIDQQAESVELRTSHLPHWQQERQTQVEHQSTPMSSACASSVTMAAPQSVSYQQLLNSCASVVHNSNAAYMQMKRYQWQRSNAPLGTPGTSIRPLSRMRTQDCSSPQVFSSVPTTPNRMKLVDALRMSSPAPSRLPDSPGCSPGLQAVPQFSNQGINKQPPFSQPPRSSSISNSGLQSAGPASPAWSVYLTPAPAPEAGSLQKGDRSVPAAAHRGGQHVSKAVQTSPPNCHCSRHSIPESSPWWRGLQHQVCRVSPGAKVQPRILFQAASPGLGKSTASHSEGVSPAHFPFRCRSNIADTAAAVAAGNNQHNERSSGPLPLSPAPSITESDSDVEQEGQDRHTVHTIAGGLPCSPLFDHGEEWSVHNNALAWAVESSDAPTLGMRSVEELLHQPAAANGGSVSRHPLLPFFRQHQEAPSHSSYLRGTVMFEKENIGPADTLAGLAQLAHKLKVSIDDKAATAVAPVVSKADVGLVVLASPLEGCGRWQQGSNNRTHYM